MGLETTVLTDRMNGEVPAHQAQERGTIVGVGDFTSPVSTDAASVRPVRTSAEGSHYKRFCYKLPIVRSATHLWNVWYGIGAYKNVPMDGGVDGLGSNHGNDWRKNYQTRNTRMFSRYKLAIKKRMFEY